MKLKRILSLALSGVLAVSMLTACGMGGSVSGNRISTETNAVRRAMNTELDTLAQDTVDYKSNNDLSNATAAVARTLTEAEAKQANTDGAVVGSSSTAAQMMKRYVEYTDWTGSFGTYNPTTAEERTFVTALLFDGEMSAEEVGKAMAANVAKWKLKDADTEANTFDGSVAAYKVTIEATDANTEDTSVWFVGLMLEQTPVK